MNDPADLPLFTQPASTETAVEQGPRPHARALAGRLSRSAPPMSHSHEPAHEQPVFEESAASRVDDNDPASEQSSRPAASMVDYTIVHEVRQRVIEAFQSGDEHRMARPITLDQDEETITGLIDSHLTDLVNESLHRGGQAPKVAERRALATAVHNAIFGAGRFEPLLELPGLENLEAYGHDNVWLEFADGRIEQGPPIADSDEELIRDLQQLARFSPSGEKDFSIATKRLRMALPDGSRLAAHAWLTPRPSLVIRKHRYLDTDLDESLRLGAVDQGLREFLAAAVIAGLNIIVCGAPGAGKTTLLRAMLNSLDPMKRIATIESMFELGLHNLPHRHQRVFPAEAQPGGEPGPDGTPLGAHTLGSLFQDALQMNADYTVVGEAVGKEFAIVIDAMTTGKGSMSTIHATSASDAVERMSSLYRKAETSTTPETASTLIAQAVDLIVYIDVVDERQIGGRRHRHVSEVLALSPNNDTGVDPVVREWLWQAGPDGRAVPTGKHPEWLSKLRRAGFDPSYMEVGTQSWQKPLDLLIPMDGGQS